MPQFAISITKRIAFRGGTQEFSNTYHYAGVGPMIDNLGGLNLIDQVVVEEKKFHSSLVSFVKGRCWSSGGTKEENQMIAEKVLTGTGSSAIHASLDPERAFLVQWPAGLDTRGRKVYLRKWYHSCGAFGTVTLASNILDQTGALSTANRNAIAAYADVLSRIGIGGSEDWGLVAESGRERDGGILSADPPVAHPWLEHHQLGDQWRG